MAEPVTLSRESISDLADVIMRRTPTGGSTGSSPGGGVNLSSAGNATKGVIDSSINGLGKLASGSFTAADALGVATGVINKVPVIGDTISNVVGKVGNAGLQLNKDLNEAGKYGVSLNNDLGMFGKGLAYSRMSSEEFVRGMERNSNGLGVLGGTADRAAKNFMGLAKDFQENPVARQLQETGISASEMNGFLTQQLVNRRTLDITDAKARQAAIEATLSLNVEMDALARQTGKSRQAQMDDLKREQSKAEVQAALMQMGEGARKQFDAMQISMGPLGKAAQSLASEIATGGVRTKEGAAQLAAMGPAGASFQAAVKQQMAARTDEEKKAAEAAMKRAQNEITAYQRTDQYLSMVRVDQQSEVGKARAQQFMENQYINSQIASENENRGKTQAELEAIRKKEIADAQSGKQTAALGGTPDGSKAGQAINQSKIVAQDIRAGMGPYFEKANDLAGKSVDYLKDISSKTPKLQALLSQGNAEEKTAQMSDAMKSLTPNALLGPTASSNPANRPAGMGSVTAPAGRSEGSLGAVGKLIEDFGKGTPMMLHGKEGVITEKQLNSIVGQTMAAGKKSVAAPQNIMGQFAPMISDMQTQMKSKMVEVQSQMPTIDSMKGMFGGMGVPQSAPPSEAPPAPTGGNNATLNEVVGSLDMLNKQMAQLLSQHDEIGRLQVRATKSTSGNRLAA
jgi:hypothetical protein